MTIERKEYSSFYRVRDDVLGDDCWFCFLRDLKRFWDILKAFEIF
jgi:hypothetical protein